VGFRQVCWRLNAGIPTRLTLPADLTTCPGAQPTVRVSTTVYDIMHGNQITYGFWGPTLTSVILKRLSDASDQRCAILIA
jgi:hypothetical protein